MRGSGRVNPTGCTTAQDLNVSTLHAVDRSRQIFPAVERRLGPLILNVSLSPSRSESRQFGVQLLIGIPPEDDRVDIDGNGVQALEDLPSGIKPGRSDRGSSPWSRPPRRRARTPAANR